MCLKRNSYFVFLLILVLIALTTSCQKIVEISTPPDRIISDHVFADDAKATAAVTGIYGSLINGSTGFANGLTTVLCGYSSDELMRINPSAAEQEFMENQLQPGNSFVQTIWASLYQHIYYTNACIEGLTNSETLAISVKQQLIAESKFLRGFCYFYLVNFFGDVPLVLSTDYKVNSLMPRVDKALVFDQIIKDLMDAKSSLPSGYVTNEKVRVNKWAASALLARVYLYLRQWQKGEAEAGEVISSGVYTPLPSPQSTFLKNSKEAIWQLLPKNGFVPEINLTFPMASMPRVALTDSLIRSFTFNDLRRQRWVDSVVYLGTKFYYPGKYKSFSPSSLEYYSVLRAGELFLIRAECRANLGNIDGAVDDLNIIRVRAGLPDLAKTLNQAEMLLQIELERKKELFAEWGHRWFDLKRTGRDGAVLSRIKQMWQSHDALYPIPQNEILTNLNLVQNSGY